MDRDSRARLPGSAVAAETKHRLVLLWQRDYARLQMLYFARARFLVLLLPLRVIAFTERIRIRQQACVLHGEYYKAGSSGPGDCSAKVRFWTLPYQGPEW